MNARRVPLALLVALAAASALPARADPSVAVESVRIDRITSAEADFAVTLTVTNPDANELSMDDARAEVKVEDVNVGRAKLTEPLRVPAGGQGVARLVAHADWNATLRAALAAAKRAEAQPAADPTVRYAVSGVAFVFGGLPVPFSRTGEFTWPRTITIK
ncbi:MAG: LEA type 2 family protein [Burkholderiales bacterium]